MLEEHLGYLADRLRLDRFRSAIAKVVTPGAAVVDLGCGSGILGLACLQAGASKVFAIDSTHMIEIAREAFERAGVADQCEFFCDRSYRIELPVRADLVICDHIGYLGFDYGIIELLKDARERFLKPHGSIVPSRIGVMLGAVQSGKAREIADGWRARYIPPEYHWVGERAVNSTYPVRLSPAEILGPPSKLKIIDLAAENPDFFSWTTELVVERGGLMHGLAGWFECELIEGVSMTNSPLSRDAITRPQAFLPIDEPAPVDQGERIKVTLMARPSDNHIAWSVELLRSGRRFKNSTWEGLLRGANDLRRAVSSRVPRLSRTGRARTIVLGYCDDHRTAGEIEQLVLREHPDLFPSSSETSRFVAEVLARDTD